MLALAATPVLTARGEEQAVAPVPVQPSGKSPSKDDLFSKAFGERRQNRARRLDLPVRLDGRELGLVKAILTGDPRASQINLTALADLLGDVANDDAVAALRAVADPEGFGQPSTLAPDGITAEVNTADLEVVVTVPPALRRLVRLEVQRRGELARGFMLLPPADISAYVNALAAIEYQSGDNPSGRERRGPLGVAFEPSVNYKGWVVEGDVTYREDGDKRWARGPTRLVKDFPADSLRLIAGDQSPRVNGTQTGRNLGGVSLSRNFSLQPYRATQPSGARQFTLDAPSTVEVFVNGRPTRTYRLGAGPYDLSSLPGTSGANDVEIRIIDSFGRSQVIQFPFFFDSQLLAPGISEFAYTAGYPSTVRGDVLTYDTGKPVFSGYHRQGVSDRLTLGAGVQADEDQQNLTAEVLFTTPYGTFALEPGLSLDNGVGYAFAARYRNYMRGEQIWQNRTITAQVNWRDRSYQPFGTLVSGSDSSLDASVRLSQPITNDLVATLGSRFRQAQSPVFKDSYAVDLSLRYRIGRGDSLDLTLNHERDPDGDTSTGIFAALRFSLGDGRHATGLSVDTTSRERRLDWRYQSFNPVDAVSLSLDALNGPGTNRLQGSAAYTHQRFLVSARHDLVDRTLGGDTVLESRTQVNAAAALAFADGHVGISRPISNSFAILVPHRRLEGLTVGVDPINGRFLAATDWLGPPVVPNISAYLIRPLLIDVPDVPLGYDLGNDRPAVEPGYRTGTLVPIGTDAAVSLDGTLVGPDGAPLALLSGVLRQVGQPADGTAAKEIQFFTNRRGRFRVEAVRPGQWELVVYGVEARPVPVEVTPEAEGVVTLGQVQLTPP